MRVLAVDPGLRSGTALWHPDSGLWTEIMDPMQTIDYCFAEIDQGRPDVVVCEAYTITSATAQKSQQPWSLEIIGALRWLCYTDGVEFRLQKPSDAKSFVPDQRLRDLGFWTPGKEDHARDATRHLVLALAKSGQLKVPPLGLHATPSEETT